MKKEGGRGQGPGVSAERQNRAVGIESYRKLKVWSNGIELSRRVYLLTGQFPLREIYGLTSQMRRAVTSIPANIAEGNARDNT